MTLDQYFEKLKTTLNPETLEGVDTIINFDLKTNARHLIVKDGKLEDGEGLKEDAEVTLTASEDALIDIIKGDTNPMMAMMMGKLKISNPGAMMKYAKILGLM